MATNKDKNVLPNYTDWTKELLENRIAIIKQRGSKNDQKEIPFIQAAITRLGA